MDYLQYVNSKDIRDYLKRIDYKPTSNEVAWLIYQSFKSSREKHFGYKKLISEMPDMKIDVEGLLNPHNPNSKTKIHYDSLHEFLTKYMEAEDMLEEIVLSGGKGSIYIIGSKYYHTSHAYKSFEDCVDNIRKSYKSRDIPWHTVRLEARTREIDYIDFVIIGSCFDRIEEVSFQNCSSELEKIYSAFGMMNYVFPVPFKKGDILQRIHRDVSKCNSDPRVFIKDNSTENYAHAEVYKITNKKWKRDLIECGINDIMDYEYAEDNIICEQRDLDLLKKISSCLKEDSVAEMLQAYRNWVLEEWADRNIYDRLF